MRHPERGHGSSDRQSIALEQEDLIQEVYKANAKTVVVLVASAPYAINWTQQSVPAIIHMSHNSQEEGNRHRRRFVRRLQTPPAG